MGFVETENGIYKTLCVTSFGASASIINSDGTWG